MTRNVFERLGIKKKVLAKSYSINDVISLLEKYLLRDVSTSGSLSRSNFRVENFDERYTYLGIRHIGKWEDDSYNETKDYDFQKPTAETREQVKKVIDYVRKETNYKIEYEFSEKHWLDISIYKQKVQNKNTGKYKEGEFGYWWTVTEGKDNVENQTYSGNINCHGRKLTSLRGAPREISGKFDCASNNLTSLEGAPEYVGGMFDCAHNQLTSLEGAPKSVGGWFNCSDNKLTTLESVPKSVGGWFNCHSNQLISLEGAPEYVGRDFDCSYNKFTSLKGAPKEVNGFFWCDHNQLTSLEGAPEYVRGGFDCSHNRLNSLEGAPEYVGGYFECTDNPDLESLDGIGEVKDKIYSDLG